MRLYSILSLVFLVACTDKGDDSDSEGPVGGAATDGGAGGDGGAAGDGGSDGEAALTGLEGYCARYKECGGSYYQTADDCVDATLNYWGDCPEMQAALDAFGDCMIDIPCSDYNPDSYNPASTDCAQEWEGVYDADC